MRPTARLRQAIRFRRLIGGSTVADAHLVLANARPSPIREGVVQADWRARGRPRGSLDRVALAASSDLPEALEIVTRLYDEFGFDTLDNSPLSESWRTRPGQPAWTQERHTRPELIANLAGARRIVPR